MDGAHGTPTTVTVDAPASCTMSTNGRARLPTHMPPSRCALTMKRHSAPSACGCISSGAAADSVCSTA